MKRPSSLDAVIALSFFSGLACLLKDVDRSSGAGVGTAQSGFERDLARVVSKTVEDSGSNSDELSMEVQSFGEFLEKVESCVREAGGFCRPIDSGSAHEKAFRCTVSPNAPAFHLTADESTDEVRVSTGLVRSELDESGGRLVSVVHHGASWSLRRDDQDGDLLCDMVPDLLRLEDHLCAEDEEDCDALLGELEREQEGRLALEASQMGKLREDLDRFGMFIHDESSDGRQIRFSRDEDTDQFYSVRLSCLAPVYDEYSGRRVAQCDYYLHEEGSQEMHKLDYARFMGSLALMMSSQE